MKTFTHPPVDRSVGKAEKNREESPLDLHSSLWKNLLNIVETNPDTTAITDSNGMYSYAFLIARASVIAQRLKLFGAKQGTRVGVLLPRGINQIASLFATAQIGAIFVPLNSSIKRPYIINDSELTLIISDSILEDAGTCQCIALHMLSNRECDNVETDNNFLAVNSKDTCAIIYTSGTTKNPKGVMINHRMIINYAISARDYMSLLPNSRVALYPEMVHIDAVFFSVSALFSGSTLYIMSEEDVQIPDRISVYLKKHCITHLYIHSEIALDIIPNQELLFFQTGGTPAKALLYGNLPEKCVYSNGYGLTEAGAFLYWCDNGSRRLPIPLGIPIRNVFVYIVNDGKLCKPCEAGELCVAGDCISNGYVRNYEGTSGRFTENPFGDGLLVHTGDVACSNEFGEIEYIGRMNRSDVSGYTDEQIENGIMERCEDCRAAVVRSHGKTYVFVQLHSKISRSLIRQAVEGHFQKLGLSTDSVVLRMVDSFPYTESHKISKSLLLSQVLEKEE